MTSEQDAITARFVWARTSSGLSRGQVRAWLQREGHHFDFLGVELALTQVSVEHGDVLAKLYDVSTVWLLAGVENPLELEPGLEAQLGPEILTILKRQRLKCQPVPPVLPPSPEISMRPLTVPIQPFEDNTLRDRILAAIAEVFDRNYTLHQQDYDPDAMGEAADAVIACLVEGLLGVSVEVLPQRLIGNGTVRIDPSRSFREIGPIATVRTAEDRQRRYWSAAAADVLAERAKSKARYSAAHDLEHGASELANAAAFYAASDGVIVDPVEAWIKDLYEKQDDEGKTERRACLVRAAAFAISAIEVLDAEAEAKKNVVPSTKPELFDAHPPQV